MASKLSYEGHRGGGAKEGNLWVSKFKAGGSSSQLPDCGMGRVRLAKCGHAFNELVQNTRP